MIIALILAIIIWIAYPNRNISSYALDLERFKDASEIMPSLESLPESKKTIYRYKKTPLLFPIWYGQSLLVVATYDDDTFSNELEKINNQYRSLPSTVNIVGPGDDAEYISSSFSVNSYEFRIVDIGSNGCPKNFGMIAVSEEKHEIAYLYFFDPELDFITPPMSDFVKSYFNYRW